MEYSASSACLCSDLPSQCISSEGRFRHNRELLHPVWWNAIQASLNKRRRDFGTFKYNGLTTHECPITESHALQIGKICKLSPYTKSNVSRKTEEHDRNKPLPTVSIEARERNPVAIRSSLRRNNLQWQWIVAWDSSQYDKPHPLHPSSKSSTNLWQR